MSPQPAIPVAFIGDGALRITDPDRASRIYRRFSPSAMKALDSCPAKAVAERLLPRVEHVLDPAPIGTDAHWVFEHLYQLQPHLRTPDEASRLIDERLKLRKSIIGENEAAWRELVTPKVMGLFSIADPTQARVEATEQRIDDATVDSVPFVGVIDLVERDSDGDFIIKDFKTGKAKTAYALKHFGDDDGDQLRIYAGVYRHLHGRLPKSASLLYTEAGQERLISITTASVNRAMKRLSSAYRAAMTYQEAGEFPMRTSPLCGWCPLVNACPAAARDGKTDKNNAPAATELNIPVLEAPASVHARPEPKRPIYDLDADLARLDPPDSTPIDRAVNRTKEEASLKDGETRKENVMETLATTHETVPYEEYNRRGEFNPNSYSAIAYFSLASMATDIAYAHYGPNPKFTAVKAIKNALANVVKDAQLASSGEYDISKGLHTRLRGALHSTIKEVPLPLGSANASDYQAWHRQAVRRVVALARIALEDINEPCGDDPFATLIKPQYRG